MAYTRNQSVVRFKQDMFNLNEQMARNIDQRCAAIADELIDNMRAAAPKRSGTLAASIHKKRVTEGDNDERVAYLVIGGGKATTKRTETGVSYDYAVGTEFGTHKEAAEPFFFNTSRRYFHNVEGSILETVDQTIENNNRARALRSENDAASDSSFIVRRGGDGHQVDIRGKQL